jgi:hypothetical protein
VRHGRRDFLRKAAPGIAALALLATPTLAHALEVEVSAVLGRSTIKLGESVYLQVEVTLDGSSRAVQMPRFPKLENVDISERGTSTGISVDMSPGGGMQRSTKTFTYVLSPRAVGEHVIDIEVDVSGQTFKPAIAPTLTVHPQGYVPEPEPAEAGDRPPAPESDVIVWPVVDKTKAYVGEQIVYELQIWDRSNGNLTVTSQPTFKDFWSENLEDPRTRRRQEFVRDEIDGVPYRVHSALERALFPQKAGTLTIGGPEIEAQEFTGPFFGGTGPPRTFVGRSLAIEVLPLPAEGQPQNFRANNVGQFRVTSEVDRTKLRQGEAVRLSVRIAGSGNIALVELPPLGEIEGIRSYEPKPETPKLSAGKGKLQGSRVYTVLLVAEQAGTIEIPAVELPFFDPESGKYAVAKSKPIVLEVEADPDARTPTASTSEAQSSGDDDDDDELLAPVIADQTLPRVTVRERWLTRERWWVGSLAAPAVLGFAWLGLSLRERYGPDDAARARSREAARRRALLNQANAAVDSGENFYPTLGSLLHTAAVARAGAEGVGLTRERLMKLLGERGASREEVDQLTELLDACDAARYGAGGGDVEQRRAHLERARSLLGRRAWRPE